MAGERRAVRVHFTVDTENSMGGAWRDERLRPTRAAKRIFCRTEQGEYGVGLLCDLLGRYGWQATFFVETLSSLSLGLDDLREVTDCLLDRGQDVQLHLHPNYHYYAEWLKAREEGRTWEKPAETDMVAGLAASLMEEVLDKGIEQFERAAGRRPVAYRSGNYSGSRRMLRALAERGVRVDSSWNPARHAHGSFPGEAMEWNVAREAEGLVEIPVTVAESGLSEDPANGNLKILDVSALSVGECVSVMEEAERAGAAQVVFVFHSFSMVKARDEQYSEMRADRIVIRRVERLFEWLSRNSSRFEVCGMGTLAGRGEVRAEGTAEWKAKLGAAGAAARKAVQAANRIWWV